MPGNKRFFINTEKVWRLFDLYACLLDEITVYRWSKGCYMVIYMTGQIGEQF